MSLSGTYKPYSFYSFVKCVDTSRIDLTEKQISPLNKNRAKTVKLLILLSSSDTGNLFVIIL